MKKIFTAIVAACILAACGSEAKNEVTANERLAADQGRMAAEEAMKQPAGSMQRQAAILKIRATQEKILQLGDTAAANAYASAAGEVLDSIE